MDRNLCDDCTAAHANTSSCHHTSYRIYHITSYIIYQYIIHHLSHHIIHHLSHLSLSDRTFVFGFRDPAFMRRMRNVTLPWTTMTTHSSSMTTHSSAAPAIAIAMSASSNVSPFINPDEMMDTLSNTDRWRSYLEAVGLDAFILTR